MAHPAIATTTLGIFNLPTGMEWVIILIALLLIFGKRAPDVGRSIGRSIVEFKKGLQGIQDDVEQAGESKGKSAAEPPLQPYDKRLGGDEAELRRLQQQSTPAIAAPGAGAPVERSQG